jgi:hypothetical protein
VTRVPNLPKLTIHLLDAAGRAIGQACDVMLWNQFTGEHKVARAPKGKSVSIAGVKGAPQGVYRVLADPASYLPSAAFVSVAASGVTEMTLRLAIDPDKVKRTVVPKFSALSPDARRILNDTTMLNVAPSLSGAALYESLDPIRSAGFLNIIKKSESTPLLNGRVVSSYFRSLTDLRGDRFFAVISQDLRDEVKHAAVGGLFTEVSSVLHHPPAGFNHAGSYKTQDHYGNLQLTFFTNGTDWVADVDIDDANGLEHVFQVVRNRVTGQPTHPYAIRDILVAHQKLDPAYEFEV